MQKVDILPVDFGCELRVAVDLCFPPAPVIAIPPIVREPFNIAHRDAVLPANSGQFVGPANAAQAILQIVEGRLRNVHCEGLYIHLNLLRERSYSLSSRLAVTRNATLSIICVPPASCRIRSCVFSFLMPTLTSCGV